LYFDNHKEVFIAIIAKREANNNGDAYCCQMYFDNHKEVFIAIIAKREANNNGDAYYCCQP
jgi:hypothetical protein